MATCNDIDASLAAVKASSDAKLAAMQSKLDGCCAKTDDALAKALQALSDVANIVKNVNGILEDIKKVTDAVAQLSSIVLPAQGLIAALLAAGAGFLLALGTLSTLGGRIDAVESGLSQLSKSTSNLIADLWAAIRNIALTPGPIGLTGDKGDKGDKGDTGSRGLTGLTGPIGLTGARGLTGATGAKGDRGLIGLTGAIGATGARGLTGLTGTKGDKGDKGDRGLTGLTGLTGKTGDTGARGLIGSTGLTGAIGLTGVRGLTGPIGLTGLRGIQGLTGLNGKDGVDKGMNCIEMQACLAPQTAALAAIKIEQSVQSVALGALSASFATFVAADTVAKVGFLSKFLAVLTGITTVIDLINKLRELLSSKKEPLTDQEMRLILDSYFPLLAGSITDTDCNGNIIKADYLGKGINGLDGLIKAVSQIERSKLSELCSSKNLQGFINTTVCGKPYTGTFRGDAEGIQRLGDLIGFAITETCRKADEIVDIIDSPIKWEPRLKPFMKVLLDEYFPVFSGTLTGTFCNGTKINAGYSGQGLYGINSGIKAQSYIDDRILQDLYTCIFNLITPIATATNNKYNGGFVGTDCDGNTIDIKYNNADLEITLQALFIALQQQSSSLCRKLDVVINPNNPNNPKNITVTGSLGLTACNTTDVFSYTTTESREATANVRGALLLIGQVLDKICTKLDAIDPTKPVNNPNVSGTLNLVACGQTYSYPYGVPQNNLSIASAKGILELVGKAFDKICQKLDTDPIANGNLTIDVCGTVITKPYSGVTSQLVRMIPTIQTQMMGQALTVICEKMEEMDCDPMILEPAEKYRERDVTTQMSIWFYPVGTTRSQRKNSPKWRINISNPKPNLTCVDFAPLTWQRGKWLSKVFFNMDAIETYSYFADYDPTGQGGDAVDKMLYLASLSQIPLLNSEPRITRANGVRPNLPNQPIMEVVRVIFVTFDANGQKTNVECLQCVP